ncbi:hypothetical protein EVAR_53843_1 [Eumeta japonica]|uniref:Uncharacterized protein n=1 Tax=Eumeta variegata TaxID=151549 RepID=A0A4C1XIP7_EUMVA|nr:hypothetical protein EVAR_53843_1 [Eumeta japonica]
MERGTGTKIENASGIRIKTESKLPLIDRTEKNKFYVHAGVAAGVNCTSKSPTRKCRTTAARGRPIIVEWERDARHSAGLSLVRVINGRHPTASAAERHIIKLNDVHNEMLYKEIKVTNMLAEMLRAEAASAMEHCALPNRRMRIQISDIHSCGGEKKKDLRATIVTCHR